MSKVNRTHVRVLPETKDFYKNLCKELEFIEKKPIPIAELLRRNANIIRSNNLIKQEFILDSKIKRKAYGR